MTTLPLGEAKAHLFELVGRVCDHHERVIVTVHGRPSAVLVAVEDLEQLEATVAIFAELMRAEAEAVAGDPEDRAEARAMLADLEAIRSW